MRLAESDKVTFKDVAYKINEISLLLLAFVLPIKNNITVIFLSVFGITTLLNFSAKNIKSKLSLNKEVVLLTVFYLFYVIQFFFSENQKAASFDLEVKASFLLFPLFMLFSNLDWKKMFRPVLISYIQGSVLSAMLLLFFSVYRFAVTDSLSYFFYTKFSLLLHPGYYSIYLNLALAGCLFYQFYWKLNKIEKYLLYTSILILVISIFLLSSKTGIIAMVATWGLAIFYGLFYFRKWKQGLLSLAIVFTVSVTAYQFLPVLKHRIDSALHSFSATDVNDSTSSRKKIWESSVGLMENNFWLGYGGDLKEEMLGKYRQNEMFLEIKKQLNAHNQYLQTQLTIGVFGLLTLVVVLIGGFVKAYKSRHVLFFAFMIIILIGFATESMLETQAGVVFFCFFYCFFMLSIDGEKRFLKNDTIFTPKN